ncbi:Pc13g05630 [Penicillium rubens Wisconsin 54-1255]|uniref:Pc13g05630 protein n=1 Tax=Penicillium rubens (strain ATCC 28089 / DSM 1075 / NRRL 1951 / Wisconsin 54-1255) TaxID=500485 RepID=B6H2X2_PENRW|nr:Pc13g05630 [Penicillium rubens Wisconsin 54-1255]
MEFKGDSLEGSKHGYFMKQALLMGEKAIQSGETPVGCVLVHNDQIVGYGMNDTNRSMNVKMLQSHPRSALQSTDLYVTVEPCVMCASALKQYRIRNKVVDRSRLTGPSPSIDPSYPVYGGLFEKEAIMLLRRFYIQENEKAPNPRPKKNRELNTRFENDEASPTW